MTVTSVRHDSSPHLPARAARAATVAREGDATPPAQGDGQGGGLLSRFSGKTPNDDASPPEDRWPLRATSSGQVDHVVSGER